MPVSSPKIMKKITLAFICLTFILCVNVKDSHALVDVFRAVDHPLTLNHPVGNTNPWGLNLSGNLFDFNNVFLTVDTSPAGNGGALLGGIATHRNSGEQWAFSSFFSNMRFKPQSQGGLSVPQDGMFDVLLNRGLGGGFVVWDDTSLSLFRISGPLAGGYTGPLAWHEKLNKNGDPSLMAYRKSLLPSQFPGEDVFGVSAWLLASDGSGKTGDFHFVAIPKLINPIPEPGTMALMAIGFSGLGFIRKKKKA